MRSRDTYVASPERALAGGRFPHSAATRVSKPTTWPGRSNNAASTEHCLPAGTEISAPVSSQTFSAPKSA
ncbi:hypothetical protein GCM10009839_79670 [Catenulispora yoronensis]|uniref:Uncharacterized protein n=1 Tax=Catenulispora yoronensis TaxID=450799 RepID=A0ABN2VBA3_9ACTN